MININLIPHEKRNRRRSRGIFPACLILPWEVLIGLIGGVIILLIVWHIVLQGMIVAGYLQLKREQARWDRMLPEREIVETVMKDLRDRKIRIRELEAVKASPRISWAEKLQAVSEVLPGGIWLRQIIYENGEFFISGSSVSKHKVEMITVHGFVKQLKESGKFMKGVRSVDLESMKNRQIADIVVADFSIRALMESSSEE